MQSFGEGNEENLSIALLYGAEEPCKTAIQTQAAKANVTNSTGESFLLDCPRELWHIEVLAGLVIGTWL